MICELIGGPKDGAIIEVDFEYLRYGGKCCFPEAVEPATLEDKPYRSAVYSPIIDEVGHLRFIGYDS